jgi:hypothetical protein
MRVYTEKEIKKFMQKNVILDELTLSLLTPIQLPSDEEIGKKAFDDFCDGQFIDGAKWMRDKILRGE